LRDAQDAQRRRSGESAGALSAGARLNSPLTNGARAHGPGTNSTLQHLALLDRGVSADVQNLVAGRLGLNKLAIEVAA
jgi:hypothetical protein